MRKINLHSRFQLTDSVGLWVGSSLSLMLAELLGFIAFEQFRDLLVALVLGLLVYVSLQTITVIRFGMFGNR